MTRIQTHFSSEKISRLLFHLVFWGAWLALPFINPPYDDEQYHRIARVYTLLTLTNIPLFFVNTEWLIPKILRKKGTTAYFLSLLILIVVSSFLQNLLKINLMPIEWFGRHKHDNIIFKMLPILFVIAVSTGYGLFTYMVEEEKNKQEKRQERLQSELAFLRSQISPHFLFNVLNSIVYLIRTRSERAEEVTLRLSELMRYQLYETDTSQITLDKELTYLKNYIELQKMRFEDDVAVHLSIEESDTSHLIEPMLMISFVENAFKHGVGMIEEPVIDIQVSCDRDTLRFSVRNKIAPEKAGEKDKTSGIGLRNVIRRLELLYPGKHELHIQKENNWFIAELTLQLDRP